MNVMNDVLLNALIHVDTGGSPVHRTGCSRSRLLNERTKSGQPLERVPPSKVFLLSQELQDISRAPSARNTISNNQTCLQNARAPVSSLRSYIKSLSDALHASLVKCLGIAGRDVDTPHWPEARVHMARG